MVFVHPTLILKLFSCNSDVYSYNTRGRSNIHLNRISSKSGSRSFSSAAAELFNDLPDHVKNSDSMRSFTSNCWFEKILMIVLDFSCIYFSFMLIELLNLFIYLFL